MGDGINGVVWNRLDGNEQGRKVYEGEHGPKSGGPRKAERGWEEELDSKLASSGCNV